MGKIGKDKIRILSFILCFVIIFSEINVFSMGVRAAAGAYNSVSANNSISNNSVSNNTVSNNSNSNNTVSENTGGNTGGTVSENTGGTVSGNTGGNTGGTVSENTGGTVSGNTGENTGGTVSENNTVPIVPLIMFHDINVDSGIKTYGKIVIKNEFGMNARKSVPGREIFVSVSANEGYVLQENSFKVVSANGTELDIHINDGWYSFVMPDSDVLICAEFKKEVFKVSVGATENGSILLDSTEFSKGEKVLLQINPSAGYELNTLLVKDADNNIINVADNSFIMPSSDVQISATFRKIRYKLTPNITGSGKVNINSASATEGERIQFSVEPAVGWELESVKVTDKNGNEIATYKNAFKMPASDVVIKVSFSKLKYNILVENTENGKITVNKTIASAGDKVQISVEPANGYDLLQLKVVDAYNRDVQVVNNAFVMPGSSVKVKAVFAAHKYSVNVVQPDHGVLHVDKEIAAKGEKVFITTEADYGYELSKIYVEANGIEILSFEEKQDVYKFEMPAVEVSIKAVFEKEKEPEKYEIIITENLEHGKIVVSQKTACAGEEVVVMAMADTGYIVEKIQVFAENGNEIPIVEDQFIMPEGNVIINASFIKYVVKYSVVIDESIEHGLVSADKEMAEAGEEVKITATADDAYRLLELVVTDKNNNHIEVTDGSFIMPAKDVRVYAVFERDVMEMASKGKNDLSEMFEDAVKGTDMENVSIDRYISSNKKIATVNKKGVVTGKKSGMVTITAQHKAAKNQYIDVYSFEINIKVPKMEKKITLNFHEPVDMSKYLVDVPYGQKVSWSVSDKAGRICTIDKNTGILDIKKDGKITVCCSIGEGKNAVKLKSEVSVKTVSFNIKDNSIIRKGAYKNVMLKNASEDADVTWVAGDSDILQVVAVKSYNKIKIKALSPGETTLTAIVDGNECKVNIVVK